MGGSVTRMESLPLGRNKHLKISDKGAYKEDTRIVLTGDIIITTFYNSPRRNPIAAFPGYVEGVN